ncbi:hypothetical protein A2966_01690 [Candidatus Roizmanbacteria bacterium RIFCSPLOWO2_01_FULL_41_22]|uniref:AAA+ ATPase domain-containing protein n=1 Tax=Candidatus Roizmanbacteria bacterium RIFCSPLOWO2_01_FULL_41_22 TaxID=1802067 RepID=A0A1F7J9P7_9BACT|nr:MAG: hypothetical protein A2966_01690 [Candidatus Roizmanbacteria bacterium RIFCSPLOWO2_01_FULL_41_22]
MSKNLLIFVRQSVGNFVEGVVNIFIFLPYFFSVSTLFKTLFSPWKSLVVKKTERGYSMKEWFDRFSFNIISRLIGLVMRLCILIFYLLMQIILAIGIPLLFVVFFLLLPLMYLFAIASRTENENKMTLKNAFFSTHLLDKNNYQAVESWFEDIYSHKKLQSQWWKLANLFTVPPLARDWTMGYTPILDQYASDLTHVSYQGHRQHLVGREKEIKQIEQVLSKSEEANVLVVGEEGVGKHAIVDAFAKRVYEGKTNPLLAYKRVLKLNMEKILNEHTDVKKREDFLEELLAEAVDAKSAIIFIENFHRYVASGQGMVDLSIPIDKYAKTDLIQIVGLTTPFYYEKYIYQNDKIYRIFSKIDVDEVAPVEAKKILMNAYESFEKRYQVTIPYETLSSVVDKSGFFITNIPFPEKAFQLLDTTCAYTVQMMKKNVVLPQYVDTILTQRTHVPTILSQNLKDKLLQLENSLRTQIIDQNEALNELAAALRRSFLLLGKRKKPLACFLFLGPTGVGKTETAKAVSEMFFETVNNMLRFDMSEYQTKEDISKLIGSSETNEPGLLTSTIREHPYGVLLLDEIEKADKNLINIFLTMFDEGYITDGWGKRVDCKNLVIIATSNAGAEYIYQSLRASSDNPKIISSATLIDYLVQNNLFSPEFLNRFDGVIAYKPLQLKTAGQIAKNMLRVITDQIFDLYKVQVTVSDQALQTFIDEGYNPAFGARNMERILRDKIEDKVAQAILSGQTKEGDTINL